MNLFVILLSSFFLLITAACNQTTLPETRTEVAPPPSSDGKLTSEQIQKLLTEAAAELEKKNFGKSIEITIRVTKSDSGNIEAYLIESQANSMTGDLKAALAALEQAFDSGLKDIERIAREQRFDPIRSTPEFQDLLRRHDFSSSTKIDEKEIRAGNVSIKEEAGAQVIKAGDITLRLPKD